MITDYISLKKILIGFLIGIFLYSLIRRMTKKQSSFEKEYQEILDSDKYKVKGQSHKA